MKPKLKILVTFLLLPALLHAQENNPDIKRTMHWYFGYNAGLDFSSGTPVADTTGKIYQEENSYNMSDTCGNLLFYGTAENVLNKNHQEMDNGDLVGVKLSPTQSIAIPQPGNDSIFYIFYDKEGGTLIGQFKYAILNINANNGLGKVISKDNILIDTVATEKVAAVHHCNGNDIWVVSKQRNWPLSKNIYAWLLTENGLITTPVVSDVALSFQKWENGDGYFRFSSDGTMAAAAYMNQQFSPVYVEDSCSVELYKFDNCTGEFYDPIVLQILFPYGLAFSPDNTKLYVEAGGEGWPFIDSIYFYQFDISNYDSTYIMESKTIIAEGISGHFQLALDGKLYVAELDTTMGPYLGLEKLGVINNPNESGLACNYLKDTIDLMGKNHVIGLPNFVDSYFSSFKYYDCDTTNNNSNFNKNHEVNIYPNPFTDIITIENKYFKDYNMKITDETGRIILEKDIHNKVKKLNLSYLKPGSYMITLYSEKFTFFTNHKITKL
ncbi:MAG: T9SS type A sorting domain-containing protein [Bacteroidota bacterium]|nr:T9SS type A sorting domain-containing protein [Bacteroidota bacterium]